MRTAVVGGGAAGFFLAVNLKEAVPGMDVTILEAGNRVLRKVEVSGGGRCNLTNSFASVTDLSQVYPRGHRLLKRLFNVFGPSEAYRWFESRGVPLVTQDDQCVFPASQDSHSITGVLMSEARRLGVKVRTNCHVTSLEDLSDYDFVAVTTGGSPRAAGLQWLADAGHMIEQPVPSLFTFQIDDTALHSLAGIVVEDAVVQFAGTRLRATGPLLITHWGLSGPAILRLSSYGARHLAERDYKASLSVNWSGSTEEEARAEICRLCSEHGHKMLASISPFRLPTKLWQYLLGKTSNFKFQTSNSRRWGDVNAKEVNRLVNVLTNDAHMIAGRATHKDEFVTCGGVSLSSVNSNTLESRVRQNLFFAGEVLDIDGVTGGFNFQAAWTTAYTVAQTIASKT